MKLSIAKTPAKLGLIQNRLEKHGDEDVTAWDIPLDGIMLDESALNALTADKHLHDKLFEAGVDGRLPEPRIRGFKPFKLAEKFEDVTVELVLGIAQDVVRFEGVKLAKLELEPQTGGMTRLAASVQVVPELEPSLVTLLKFQQHDITVAIEGGKRAGKAKKQAELPMPEPPAPPPKPRGNGKRGHLHPVN